MSKTETPVITPYVEQPDEACLTAAYKLQVVIRLLHGVENDDNDGGYGVSTAADLVSEIQAALRASAAAADAAEGAITGGKQ